MSGTILFERMRLTTRQLKRKRFVEQKGQPFEARIPACKGEVFLTPYHFGIDRTM
jgi:hypothetical protein